MPRNKEVFIQKLKEYERRQRIKGLSKHHISETQRVNRKCLEILESQHVLVGPKKITQDHLYIIRHNIPLGENGNESNRKYHVETFRTFLRKMFGHQVEGLNWPTEEPRRPRIDSEQYARMLIAAEEENDIVGCTVLFLFGLTARRKAVLSALPEDIHEDYILFKDKGKGGKKERKVPIMPEERFQLDNYLRWREQTIQRVLKNNPEAEVPSGLIIWATKNSMGTVHASALNNWVKKYGRRIGIHLESHMIRRMACKELWKELNRKNEGRVTATDIQTAMAITGHSRMETFMMYVGAIDDEKAELMTSLSESRKKLMDQIRGITA